MDFDKFKYKVSNLKNLPLPGVEAQLKLAPILRIRELEKIDFSSKNSNKAGVMAVFYPDNNSITHLALILRKTYRGVHSNQVGFPGGRIEDIDKNLKHTALRETEEEIGIPGKEIKVLKRLTRLYIPPSDFWVYPYVGLFDNTPIFIPQESEVEQILEVALQDLLSEESLITKKLSTSYAEEIEVPAFFLNGHVVWGATAMMLSELKDMLKTIL